MPHYYGKLYYVTLLCGNKKRFSERSMKIHLCGHDFIQNNPQYLQARPTFILLIYAKIAAGVQRRSLSIPDKWWSNIYIYIYIYSFPFCHPKSIWGGYWELNWTRVSLKERFVIVLRYHLYREPWETRHSSVAVQPDAYRPLTHDSQPVSI